MFHIGFMKTVYQLLQCVCVNCSRLLANRESLDFKAAARIPNGKRRMLAMLRLCRGKKTCAGPPLPAAGEGGDGVDPTSVTAGREVGCGQKQPAFAREGLKITLRYPDGDESRSGDLLEVLTAERAHAILSKVSEEDARLLGLDPTYAKPSWLIVTVLPVAPPHVRPSVALDSINRGMDDLTHKYADIVKANNALKQAKASGQPAVMLDQCLMVRVCARVRGSCRGWGARCSACAA